MKKNITVIFKGTELQEIIDLSSLKKENPTFKDIEKYIKEKNENVSQIFTGKIIFEYLNLSKKYIELTHDTYFRDHAFRVNYTFYISQIGGINIPTENKIEKHKPTPPPQENNLLIPPPIEKIEDSNKIIEQESKPNITSPLIIPIVEDKKVSYKTPETKNDSGGYQANNEFDNQHIRPMRYADFGTRLGAYLLDGLIFGMPMGILNTITGFMGEEINLLFSLLILVASFMYFAGMESSEKQGTFGKQIVGIKVVDMNGDRVSFGKATGRYFGKMLSGFFLIGYIMVGFTEKNQGLHDIMAGCLIIHKD